MALTEEQRGAIPPANSARSTDSIISRNLTMAEPPSVDDLMPGFTPQQLASLENMMNAAIKAALDERLGSNNGKAERDSAVDLNDDDDDDDDHPASNDPHHDNKNQPFTEQQRSLTIEMPGFAEEQVSTLETMLNMTVKGALDERLGPRTTDVGIVGAGAARDGDDVDMMVEKGVSPRGSQVNHLGVNGVEDGSRFAC